MWLTRTTISLPWRLALILLVGMGTITEGTTVVDLSQSWATGSLYNQNKGHCTIQAAMVPNSAIGYVVIQNGEIVSESYTTGSDSNGKYDAWSATKSWATFFVGVLVDQGSVSITETLADIFDTDADWNGVTGADDKKTIRVEELLTMSSGLVPAACQPGANEGQDTLQAVLNHVDYDSCQRGSFNYIGQTHILSRIIERRSGQSPRQFAQSAGIFTKLGMSDGDFDWTTFGGIEGSAYGLKTNPRILAKLGQLYLQGGLAATGDQLVSSSWVTASVQSYITADVNCRNSGVGYGYQWFQTAFGDGSAAAVGAQGQYIVFIPSSNTTIAVMAQGCRGAQTSATFVETIAANLGDLSVPQSSCSQSFSYWKYFAQHPNQLLGFAFGEQAVPYKLRGSGPV